MALVSVFIIPRLNAWHKEHKFKKALKQDPVAAETGIMVQGIMQKKKVEKLCDRGITLTRQC